MKTFILLAFAVAACRAGFEGYDNGGGHGQGDNGGYQYSAPLVSNGGHDFSGGQADFSGHGQDFSGGHGQDFSGGHGQGNDYTLALAQGQDYGHGQQGFDLGGHGQSFDIGHGPVLNNFVGGDSYLQAAHDLGNQFDGHQGDVSGPEHQEGHGGDGNGHGQGFILEDGGQEYGHGGHDFSNVEAIPVGEHVDEEHPVEVPNYKHVTVPIHRPLHVNVPKPILIGVPQPYPVKVPVHKPVAVPVETEISIPIEKVVPYPVVKHVPYPVEKHVPIRVEKTVHVHVPQPYPVKIPVYKTIHHHKGHH
ncbi:glycine-rich cell wall structural protein 1.8-like [Colias croceus]|uniref:glycine-rich cell wall structural protein 1.8-like n=1 Tax=Colias crocea TaxID=72248 RepID=UPI001E281925|nr:glycine-rich cell wall structural protein 1.8-like [Colias croceus]